jgi:hypothetical protein
MRRVGALTFRGGRGPGAGLKDERVAHGGRRGLPVLRAGAASSVKFASMLGTGLSEQRTRSLDGDRRSWPRSQQRTTSGWWSSCFATTAGRGSTASTSSSFGATRVCPGDHGSPEATGGRCEQSSGRCALPRVLRAQQGGWHPSSVEARVGLPRYAQRGSIRCGIPGAGYGAESTSVVRRVGDGRRCPSSSNHSHPASVRSWST